MLVQKKYQGGSGQKEQGIAIYKRPNEYYVNPQNTIMNSNRYSKLSTSTACADIGEETSRNIVNETKTIKDKNGISHGQNQPQQRPHSSKIFPVFINFLIDPQQRSQSSDPKDTTNSRKLTTLDMQPILD